MPSCFWDHFLNTRLAALIEPHSQVQGREEQGSCCGWQLFPHCTMWDTPFDSFHLLIARGEKNGSWVALIKVRRLDHKIILQMPAPKTNFKQYPFLHYLNDRETKWRRDRTLLPSGSLATCLQQPGWSQDSIPHSEFPIRTQTLEPSSVASRHV